ncbi:MAG: type III pantothenate kinase [Bacteroidota bacterium]
MATQNDFSSYLLAVDEGNTLVKVGLFTNGQLSASLAFLPDEPQQLEALLISLPLSGAVPLGWIRTGKHTDWEKWLTEGPFSKHFQIRRIQVDDSLPIINTYKTPHTLGTDRILGVIGARAQFPDKAVLVIDIGTAITYDLMNAEGAYLGGAISPGLQMRFSSLHAYTASLPLVEMEGENPVIGNTTHTSIRSGVVHGLLAEVQQMANRFAEELGEQPIVFLTGGDGIRFENQLKSINFVDPELVLKGIHYILQHS